MTRRRIVGAGARLAQLRIASDVPLEQLARVYGGRKSVHRILDIESSFWLNQRVIRAYELALMAIMSVRKTRVAPSSDCENPKTRSDGEI